MVVCLLLCLRVVLSGCISGCDMSLIDLRRQALAKIRARNAMIFGGTIIGIGAVFDSGQHLLAGRFV